MLQALTVQASVGDVKDKGYTCKDSLELFMLEMSRLWPAGGGIFVRIQMLSDINLHSSKQTQTLPDQYRITNTNDDDDDDDADDMQA